MLDKNLTFPPKPLRKARRSETCEGRLLPIYYTLEPCYAFRNHPSPCQSLYHRHLRSKWGLTGTTTDKIEYVGIMPVFGIIPLVYRFYSMDEKERNT